MRERAAQLAGLAQEARPAEAVTPQDLGLAAPVALGAPWPEAAGW